LNLIPDGSEYLLVETVSRTYGRRFWYHWDSGTTHAELREGLEESRGVPVAFGHYPPWLWMRESTKPSCRGPNPMRMRGPASQNAYGQSRRGHRSLFRPATMACRPSARRSAKPRYIQSGR